MRIACAWCEEESGETPAESVSHGICEWHYREQMLDLEIKAAGRRARAAKEYAARELGRLTS